MPTSNCSTPGRKFGDDPAQFRRQPVGNHFKVIEIARLVAREEKFENGLAGGNVEIEGTIHELELFQAAVKRIFACRPERISPAATARTGTSSDDRQNSHLKGQPREAST